MKKFLTLALLTVLLATFVFAIAENSKQNDDITHVDVPEDVEIEIVPDPVTEKELTEDLKTDYMLIIHYVFADGAPAADDYSDVLPAGAPYDVFSPTIDNYTASTNEIADVMPKRDVEYTVIYITQNNDTDYDFNDYETPLGLGFLNMNMGVQFE